MKETETRRVTMRTLPPEVAVGNWDQVILGYSEAEAIEEARRSLPFDLELAQAGCPFHVDVRRLVDYASRGEWDEAAAVVHEAHPFPQILGMHCHRYCETELALSERLSEGPGRKMPRPGPEGSPNSELRLGAGAAGADRPRLEGVELPPAIPFVSALEWAAGRFGARPSFQAGPPTGKRLAVVGAGTAGLMCAWALRRYGHAVDVYDRERLPGGLLWTGYPSFRMTKQVVLDENDARAWGVNFHAEHSITPADLQRMVDEYDAVFFAIGRTPLRSFGGLDGEDLGGILVGLDLMREVWYGARPAIGLRALVFGGGFSAFDVVRTARRLGCSAQMLYRRGVDDMPVGRHARLFTRMLEGEGIKVRTMVAPKRFIGRAGAVAAVELVHMEYSDEVDASGRRETRPIRGSEEIVEVDTVLRSIGEICDVAAFAAPLGIELEPRGFIRVDRISRRTTHPKVWAGGDVTAGLGNHTAAHDGQWAARSIHAFLEGRHDEWRSEAAADGDADLLIRDGQQRASGLPSA